MHIPQAKWILLTLSILVILGLTTFAATYSACPWRPTFRDEFNGPSLDTTRWNTAYWWGRTNAGNNEAQYYVDDAFEINDGILRIKAQKQSEQGFDYTSGIITTFGRFSQTYGRFEIRARVPQGRGLWPAFWLVPQSKAWPPEIDIFEIRGQEPSIVHMVNHWKGLDGAHEQVSGNYTGPDFSKDFHTFAVVWTPSEIIWYVEGVEQYRTAQGVASEPMYVIANLAVGGEWPGLPDGSTPFPSYLEVDYIRVYQQSCAQYLPFVTHHDMYPAPYSTALISKPRVQARTKPFSKTRPAF
jgi:beta-glucanase (GH16 family)